MDLKKVSRKAAERIRQDDTENLCRLAARLTQMQKEAGIPDTPETSLAYALRTRRLLRTPLSSAR